MANEPRPSASPSPTPPCSLKIDAFGSLSLHRILNSFNAAISEEQAWALCYQCALCCKTAWDSSRDRCLLVSEVDEIYIHKDGQVHMSTVFGRDRKNSKNAASSRTPATSECQMVSRLGLVIYRALDYGLKDEEERNLSPDLEQLIDLMTSADDRHETDDEGIERDSGDSEDDTSTRNSYTFSKVLQHCSDHLATPSQADTHYRAVCRALVAEALELSSFLEKVAGGTHDFHDAPSPHLESLLFTDWARLWVQVIKELRHGVQLKKVDSNPRCPPIEYELTPYEILMDDIRSRRYKLNKVMVDGDIPPRVKKDAHAIILEFIRSRPPLKKVSDRELGPAPKRASNPIELLLESIRRQDHALKKTPKSPQLDDRKNTDAQQGGQTTRRLIKVDFSLLDSADDDDDDDDYSYSTSKRDEIKDNEENRRRASGSLSLTSAPNSPLHRTVLDLATQCSSTGKGKPNRRTLQRRHTIAITPTQECKRVPLKLRSLDSASPPPQANYLGFQPLPSTCSWGSLQDEFFHSHQWQQEVECLSLTLEEVVHIRNVLTKAELESLPVDCSLKDDVEKGKVCFLCLRTRFSIFGPWGHKCRLCRRTVCAKCHSKMRIPTEHFSKIPVFTLSPNLSPREEEGEAPSFAKTLVAKLSAVPEMPELRTSNSVGSAPPSPQLGRGCGSSSGGDSNGDLWGSANGSNGIGQDAPVEDRGSAPHSLPTFASVSQAVLMMKRKRLSRKNAPKNEEGKAEKLKGSLMIVCHDCKAMVLQVIRSSRAKRSNVLKQMSLKLDPVY